MIMFQCIAYCVMTSYYLKRMSLWVSNSARPYKPIFHGGAQVSLEQRSLEEGAVNPNWFGNLLSDAKLESVQFVGRSAHMFIAV